MTPSNSFWIRLLLLGACAAVADPVALAEKGAETDGSDLAPTENHDPAPADVSPPDEPTARTKAKTPRRTFAAGIGLGVPDAASVFGRYLLSKHWSMQLSLSAPLPLTVPIDVPEQVVAAGNTYKLVTRETRVDLKVSYGPQAAFDLFYLPGTHWFLLTGLGYRRITVTANAVAPLLACPVGQASCAGNGADGASTLNLDLKGEVISTSLMGRLGFGYQWRPWRAGFLALAAGVTAPMTTSRTATVDAAVESNFGPLIQALVNAYMQKIVADEQDAAKKEVLGEVAKYDSTPLPLLGLNAGWEF